MNTIAVHPGNQTISTSRWRAFADGKESFGQTLGEAVDALSTKLDDASLDTLIVRRLQPDSHFTAAQQTRLAGLMAQWRQARDAGISLSPAEQTELQSLVDAELVGATQRAVEIEKALLADESAL
jgi:hypothetical protein